MNFKIYIYYIEVLNFELMTGFIKENPTGNQQNKGMKCTSHAPVAQLAEAIGLSPIKCGFESLGEYK